MSIEQETQYHRSFLSQNYTDNFADYLKTAGSVGYAVRQDREVQEIRDGDPDGFEAARKALAALLKVPYQPTVSGSYSGDRGGGYYREGNPPDAKVAEYLKPTYPPQSAVTNPATGNVALPNLLLGKVAAFRKGATLLRTTMFYKLDQIRRVTADAEGYRRSEHCRPGVLTGACRRRLGQPDLLPRDLGAVDAFVAVEKHRERFGLVGVDPDHDPGLTPWLLERVADVTHDRLPGRDCESMQRAPLFPCRFQPHRGPLRACHQLWITHSFDPPLKADRPRQHALRDLPGVSLAMPDCSFDVACPTGADPPFP